jgi:IstB-like ATP binding protein
MRDELHGLEASHIRNQYFAGVLTDLLSACLARLVAPPELRRSRSLPVGRWNSSTARSRRTGPVVRLLVDPQRAQAIADCVAATLFRTGCLVLNAETAETDNLPLPFTVREIDAHHEYLATRGITFVPSRQPHAKRMASTATIRSVGGLRDASIRPRTDLDDLGATIFFHLISARYERGSIILTSNKTYGEWAQSSAIRSLRPPLWIACCTTRPPSAFAASEIWAAAAWVRS